MAPTTHAQHATAAQNAYLKKAMASQAIATKAIKAANRSQYYLVQAAGQLQGTGRQVWFITQAERYAKKAQKRLAKLQRTINNQAWQASLGTPTQRATSHVKLNQALQSHARANGIA